MTQKYNDKDLYSFIRDDYNVGHIRACSTTMKITQLDITLKDEARRIAKYKTVLSR